MYYTNRNRRNIEEYNLNCEFDINKHKKTFLDYLEVLILENGKIVYAVPSHQRKAEDIACEKLGITRDELVDMCPPKYYCDYLVWLLSLTGSVSVWDTCYIVGKNGMNKKQKSMLKLLKLSGLYKGGL